MNLRDALIDQHPSLALQRAAQAEIARLDLALLAWQTHYAAQEAYTRAQAAETELPTRMQAADTLMSAFFILQDLELLP